MHKIENHIKVINIKKEIMGICLHKRKKDINFLKNENIYLLGVEKIPFVGRQHIAVTEFALNIMLEFIAF